MNEKNRESLILFAKVACVMILVMICIISGAGVWNACALGAVDGFVCGVSVVNFLLEIAAIVWVSINKLFKKKTE